MEEKLLTAEQVAEILQVRVRRVYDLVRGGELVGVFIGRYLRIAPRDLPRLFQPLYRGDDSRNGQTGGAGIGLAVAQRILVAHGGSLSAANRPEGGAIFTGTLPAARRNVTSNAQASSSQRTTT